MALRIPGEVLQEKYSLVPLLPKKYTTIREINHDYIFFYSKGVCSRAKKNKNKKKIIRKLATRYSYTPTTREIQPKPSLADAYTRGSSQCAEDKNELFC